MRDGSSPTPECCEKIAAKHAARKRIIHAATAYVREAESGSADHAARAQAEAALIAAVRAYPPTAAELERP